MTKINKWKTKLDKKQIGLILGIVFPILAFLLFWQWQYSDKNLTKMFYLMRHSPNRSNILIFPLLPNLVLFYISNFRLKWERFSLGMVMITVILTIIVTILVLL